MHELTYILFLSSTVTFHPPLPISYFYSLAKEEKRNQIAFLKNNILTEQQETI